MQELVGDQGCIGSEQGPDLCQTGFCLSIIENRNFPESSILYLASKGVFSFICLSAGSRKDRFNSAKFFCWDSGKRKRSFNQAWVVTHKPEGGRLENGKYPTLSLFFKQEWQAAMSEQRTLTFFIKIRFVLFWISLETKNIASVIYPALFWTS